MFRLKFQNYFLKKVACSLAFFGISIYLHSYSRVWLKNQIALAYGFLNLTYYYNYRSSNWTPLPKILFASHFAEILHVGLDTSSFCTQFFRFLQITHGLYWIVTGGHGILKIYQLLTVESIKTTKSSCVWSYCSSWPQLFFYWWSFSHA